MGVWTHPGHSLAAGIGIMANIFSAIFVFASYFGIPWFVDNRHYETRVTESGKQRSFMLYTMDINCGNGYCETGDIADWQMLTHIFLWIAMGANAFSILLQLIFWILFSRVINPLLRICQIVDFLGAPFKFVAAFMFIHHSPDINKNYAWYKKPDILQLDSLGIGMVLFSYILEILCCLCLTVALDKGARGQPTHRILLGLDKTQEEIDMEMEEAVEKNLMRRASSFRTDETEAHNKVLAHVRASFVEYPEEEDHEEIHRAGSPIDPVAYQG